MRCNRVVTSIDTKNVHVRRTRRTSGGGSKDACWRRKWVANLVMQQVGLHNSELCSTLEE